MGHVGDLVEVGVALQGGYAAFLVQVIVRALAVESQLVRPAPEQVSLLQEELACQRFQVFGLGALEHVGHAQGGAHAPAQDEVILGHTELLPDAAGGIEIGPAGGAQVVEVGGGEPGVGHLPESEGGDPGPAGEVELVERLGRVFVAPVGVYPRQDGLGGHAHAAGDLVFRVQHPLIVEISLHHESAAVGHELFPALQLQAALEPVPGALQGASLVLAFELEPTLDGGGYGAPVDLFDPRVVPVHGPNVQDAGAQVRVGPEIPIKVFRIILRSGAQALLGGGGTHPLSLVGAQHGGCGQWAEQLLIAFLDVGQIHGGASHRMPLCSSE